MVYNEIVIFEKDGPSNKDTKRILQNMENLGSRRAKKVLQNLKKYWDFVDIFEEKHRYDPYLIESVKELKPDGLRIQNFKGNKYRIVEYDDPYGEYLETPNDVKFITIKK
jgi:hypothetical protein